MFPVTGVPTILNHNCIGSVWKARHVLGLDFIGRAGGENSDMKDKTREGSAAGQLGVVELRRQGCLGGRHDRLRVILRSPGRE